MKIEDAIKRYELWAEDDRIDVIIRKEHRQIADWLKELKADRPQGEWIRYYPYMLSVEDQIFNGAKNPTEPIPDKRFARIKCSLCGCPHPIPNDNFCPNCGARMNEDSK